MAVLIRLMPAIALAVAFSACGDKNKPAAQTPNQARTSAQPAPVADERPVIVAFGDSLSAGFGVEPGKSFPDDVQRLLDAEGFRYRIQNMGVSGDTTTDGVERLPNVLSAHPAIVILEFGGNDGLRGQPVQASRQNMEHMIQAITHEGAKIVLAGMTLPRNYGPEYIHSFEQIYVDLAKQYKLTRIPFLLEGVGGNAQLMQPDGIHPTAEGADIVAHTVMKYLRPLLRK